MNDADTVSLNDLAGNLKLEHLRESQGQPGPLLQATVAEGEVTFAMLKSHIVADYRLAGAVISRVLGTGLVIMTLSQTVLTNRQIAILYQEHEVQPYYLDLARSVSGPVMPMALRGVNAIHRWRTLLGATNSMVALPGTLRATFGSRQKVADNVAHGSDSVAAARRELALFFPADLRLFP